MASNNQPIIVKKVKKGGHGHHGGAWKVAFADFVTAMMAFFMVMWIIGLSQQQRSLIQAYFNDPIGFSKNMPRNGINILDPTGPEKKSLEKQGQETQKVIDSIKEVEDAQKEIQKAIDSDPRLQKLAQNGSLVLQLTPSGLMVELIQAEKSGDAFFEVGQAAVKPSALPLLGKVGKALAASRSIIKIQGHTDARPYPSTSYDNYSLSSDRANAVRRVLMSNGVTGHQIASVDAYADKLLKVPTDPYSHLNRRVSILVPYKDVTTINSVEPEKPSSSIKPHLESVESIKPDLHSGH